jgi:hypothetical protein
MENIKIIDNFLDEKELNSVLNLINNAKWNYGHSSGWMEKVDVLFFGNYDIDKFIVTLLKKKIELLLNKKFVVNRMYMHMQTYGSDGSYHEDDIGEDKYTFCIYINNIPENLLDNAGGEFLIKIPNEKIIMGIETLFNRCVIFPSEYTHKGYSYSRYISSPRICLTWKIQEI